MTNIRDLMCPTDALEVEERFERALREHNEREEEIGRKFRETVRREVFDWEVDVPEFDW